MGMNGITVWIQEPCSLNKSFFFREYLSNELWYQHDSRYYGQILMLRESYDGHWITVEMRDLGEM